GCRRSGRRGIWDGCYCLLLVVVYAHAHNVRLVWRRPEVAVALNGLVADEVEHLSGEVGIRGTEDVEVALSEEVHDEEVVCLAQELVGDRAGLLRDEDRAEPVLAPFLDPADVDVLVVELPTTKYRLRFFHSEEDTARALSALGELGDATAEQAVEHDPNHRVRVVPRHRRHVEDHHARRRVAEPEQVLEADLNEVAARAVQTEESRDDVVADGVEAGIASCAPGRSRLSNLEDPSQLLILDLEALRAKRADKPGPVVLPATAEVIGPDARRLLWRHKGGDELTRRKLGYIDSHVASDHTSSRTGRWLPLREHPDPLAHVGVI